MKIHNKQTGNWFILPLKSNVNLICMQKYKEELIDCLITKFNGKRKNKDIIIDENGNEDLGNVNVIYQPYLSTNIESNFNFKAKSTFNIELAEMVAQNPELFQSVERIRESCYELRTDRGMYIFQEILSTGIEESLTFDLQEFSLNKLLEMFQIHYEELEISEQYIMLYNFLLFLNRGKTNMIFIDFPIDDITLNWINQVRSDTNYFFMDNESIQSNNLQSLSKCNIIKLSNEDYKEEYDVEISNIQTFSYLFHDFIAANIHQQTEKNIKILNMFSDERTTFLIQFNDQKLQNIV